MEDTTNACTVVSMVPFKLNEFKPGLHPRTYQIPPSVDGKPQVLVIDTGLAHVPMPDNRPPLALKIIPSEIARSVVDDYIDAQMDSGGDAVPGLAWVHGKFTAETVAVKFPKLLKELEEKNKRWFLRLVLTADDDWARYRNHRVISDFQRTACKLLGLEREWNVEVKELPKSPRCPGCGGISIAGTAVCGVCKCVLDKEAHAKLTFA